MCLQDCLRDPEKGLLQGELFYSNGTARKKGECLVSPENPVHMYVLFGILSVQPPAFVQSPCCHP